MLMSCSCVRIGRSFDERRGRGRQDLKRKKKAEKIYCSEDLANYASSYFSSFCKLLSLSFSEDEEEEQDN